MSNDAGTMPCCGAAEAAWLSALASSCERKASCSCFCAIDSLVLSLGRPEDLYAKLRGNYGLLLASRDVPPGEAYDTFGELFLSGLAESLGDSLGEEAKAAWRDAYTEASACMQTAYTLSQLAPPVAEAPAEAPAEAEA